MTIAEIQNNAKTKMEKTKDVLRSDLMAIRAGRANPQLLDRITVDYYGTPTPLKNVANISAPEPRILQINPWDAKMVKDISRAIQASDLGLTPSNDGKVIRLMLPELTEEEKRALCSIAREVRPDFIKTSTGFGTGGATFEDVALMKKCVGDEVKIKAAGGIRTLDTALRMIELGVSRIGSTASVSIVEELKHRL